MKLLQKLGWFWFTRVKANRLVHPDGTGNRQVAHGAIRHTGTYVHRTGSGSIQVFRVDTPDGDTEYWATNDGRMTMGQRTSMTRQPWAMET